MFTSLDTRIAFFGGACNIAALEAVVRLVDAGYEVIAGQHDPREGVILNDAGVHTFQSRIEATQGVQVILTSCAHPEEVENLYLGDNGLLEVAEPGTFFIDLSLTTPRLAQEIQAMAAVNDLTFIDAPLLNVGEQEQAVCFMGGEPEAIELISPLLPYLAPTVRPLGSPGEGQLSAVMVIIALAGSLMGTIEAMAMAHICGFDTRSALDALASTGAASRALIDYVPRVLNYDFTGRMSIHEFIDFLDTALLASEDMDVTLPMVETAFQLSDLLSVVGGDSMNVQALALLYEDEQTCADYGLDWALADQIREEQAAQQGFPGYPQQGAPNSDQMNQDLKELFNSIQSHMGAMNAMGAMGTGNDGLDDYRNRHTRKPKDDDDDRPDFPSMGEFFGKN